MVKKTIDMRLVLLFSLVLIFDSCEKDKCKDDDLALSRETYTGNELNTNGYYYCKPKADTSSLLMLIFYKNGVVIDDKLGGIDKNWWEESFRNGQYYNSWKNTKWIWGTFKITSGSLEVASLDFHPCAMPAYLKSGIVVNDSTFLLTESKRSKDGSEYKLLNDTFHLKQFSPKPDSTNKFVN